LLQRGLGVADDEEGHARQPPRQVLEQVGGVPREPVRARRDDAAVREVAEAEAVQRVGPGPDHAGGDDHPAPDPQQRLVVRQHLGPVFPVAVREEALAEGPPEGVVHHDR
ncbi:MAG: hypothetical protein ACK559_09975, partial [bacterium]